MRVLVVEDASLLRQQLKLGLEQAGFVVDDARDGRTGVYLAVENDYDAAIIDLGLPELDGISLIRQMREAGQRYPVLILTARGDWQDKVSGLDAGADDYVVKPFRMEEILARLNALMRRAAGFASPVFSSSVISSGPIQLDTSAKRVSVNGTGVDLTAYEYKTLEYLMLHPDQVVSKTELTEHLYAQDYDRDSNVLEVFVRRLRQKLDPDQTLNPIETVRGQGYRMRVMD